jgi:glycosyltransferase
MLTFSVITAVLNRAEVVEHALLSVGQQTWPRVEHVLIDGASSDGTLEIVSRFRDRLAVLTSEPDGGIFDALNKGIARSSGDLIGFLHSDDFYADNTVLERVGRVFEETDADGVYGDLDYVARNNPSRVIRRWRAGLYHPSQLRRGWMPPHPALFLRRSVITTWGGFDTRLRIAADYDAVLRYLKRGRIPLAYIPDVLVKMRRGGESNRSLSRVLRKTREDYAVLRRHRVGGVGALMWKNVSKLPQFIVR